MVNIFLADIERSTMWTFDSIQNDASMMYTEVKVA